ncbi:ADP-ribosylglycohydrolase family protein [Amnibacterium sp. CER49]|uniref:ADP-ribosylglycohydrolase family protein n=1 Tax=Amnibacterium sp. CER49 TaxID=3039161 RepID=UPI0024498CB5|nr:ADP-ribosylglycohydrolase family protein [Amnibacterium sp. CER49]MDH2443969.1 ADP-ribosylglycohydrolase family protein [Amnibacterium sp. CER49]
MTPRERALGTLLGLAIGDALGMPTQTLTRAAILAAGGVEGMRAAAPDHPLAAGLPAGSVTDDTEQALLLADVLLEGGGHADPRLLAERLAAWEDDMRRRGSLDLLGPSTRAAVQAVLAGTPPERSGRGGTTNGAAMRIAPVGILMPPDDLGALVDRVAETCLVSHDTGVAIAGAAAVAAAVSAGVAGADADDAADLAARAARLGASRGGEPRGTEVADRIERAIRLGATTPEAVLPDRIAAELGTSLATAESVPAAFAVLARFPDDPWRACRAAAALGGDTDTIAAMAGAMGGARTGPAGFPTDVAATVVARNRLELSSLADRLLALR